MTFPIVCSVIDPGVGDPERPVVARIPPLDTCSRAESLDFGTTHIVRHVRPDPMENQS
jgi:hypothetical protein